MKRVGVVAAAGLAVVLAIAAAAAAETPETKPEAKWDTCANCHADLVKNFAGTPHAHSAASCEGCHGDMTAHVEGGGDVSKVPHRFTTMAGREVADVCLTCHEKGKVVNWTGSPHDTRNLGCTNCHDPHPKTAVAPAHLVKAAQMQLCGSCHQQQQAKMFRSAHMPVREGKMNCTSCHNPHGTVNERMLQTHSVNENCYQCHMEKRGPFLWEHGPVRENCTTCHDPHGSVQENMLVVKMPVLCQNCHVSSRHPSQTHVSAEKFAFNHACLNCHPMIHGSNHPTGEHFMR